MYRVTNILKQEPASLTAVVVGWITVVVVAGWVDVSAETLAAVEGAILGTLLLFYVRTQSTPVVSAQKAAEDALRLQESEITAFLAQLDSAPVETPRAKKS